MKKIIFLLCITFVSNVYAAPSNWPWRGVSVSSTDFGPNDISYLKSNAPGMNHLRLTANVRSYATVHGITANQAWLENKNWLLFMLDACKANNLSCLVNINQFPIDPTLGLTQESPAFWSNESLRNQVVKQVGELSKLLSTRGIELSGYEFLSEPLVRTVDGNSVVPKEWPDFLKKIIEVIRKYDRMHYIVVVPGPGGTPSGYALFKPVSDPINAIVYDMHMYWPPGFTHQGIGGSSCQ